jgi:TonB family protein
MQAQTLKYKNLINNKAALWTIGVHVILLLLFILVKYSSPVAVAAVPDMGMEVNLGTDADGSGDDQPMAVGDPAADRSARRYHAPAQAEDAAKEIMQSDDADAPAIKPVQPNTAKHNNNAPTEKNTSRNNNQQQTASNTPHTQPQRPKYTYAGSSGPGGNGAVMDKPGTGEGNTTGNGDRGVPGGTPGAANYTGNPGSGNGGFAVSGLGDRSISPAVFNAEFHEGGKVVARVTVQKDGTISSISIVKSPSAELSRIATQKLRQARFTRSSSSEQEQFGTVTIVFKARS